MKWPPTFLGQPSGRFVASTYDYTVYLGGMWPPGVDEFDSPALNRNLF